jgi:hypothetical protein
MRGAAVAFDADSAPFPGAIFSSSIEWLGFDIPLGTALNLTLLAPILPMMEMRFRDLQSLSDFFSRAIEFSHWSAYQIGGVFACFLRASGVCLVFLKSEFNTRPILW